MSETDQRTAEECADMIHDALAHLKDDDYYYAGERWNPKDEGGKALSRLLEFAKAGETAARGENG